jgi:2,4-dienoyl-CoA reductase-like NADH-dependent reductase (Old Yellow Enzyme family)
MSHPLLLTPLEIRKLTLKNRIVIAPMHQYSADQGFAIDWHIMNAGRYAAGGAGLVMMESTKVARNGCGTVGDLGLWQDAFIPGLTRCVDFIKQHGAAAGIQLGHSGRKARLSRPWEGGKPLTGEEADVYDWEGWELVAPSAVPHSDRFPTPRALTHDEVQAMIGLWADAAARADKCGFDMLEIHAAHGYLLHQFLSPVANVRNDEYGGSEENRMRFPVEVAASVRSVWPADKPLFMRLSCEDDAGWGPEESVRLAARLKDVGVDVIDCSSGGTLERSPMDSERSQKYGYQVPYAEKIRREADIMTMAVGHIVHADQAEAILQDGRADLVALAREVMYNPNWPLDAARKLGVEQAFAMVPSPYAYWLSKRAASRFEGRPSTFGPGIWQAGEERSD